MINPFYLNGVSNMPYLQFPGIFAIPDYRGLSSSRVVCSYANGKRYKTEFLKFLKKLGQFETEADWSFHHIVEGQHFASIDFKGEYDFMYEQQLPCILIHTREEHSLYTGLANTKETKKIYFDETLPKAIHDRSKHVVREARDIRNRTALLKRLENIMEFYNDAYTGDRFLQKIAHNVLLDAKGKL